MIPSRSIEFASSASAWASKSRRGCLGLGFTCRIGTKETVPSFDASGVLASGGAAAGAVGALREGRSEWSPLPSALRGSFLLIRKDLFCQLDIRFGTAGAGIIHDDGLAVAGCFGEADISGDHGLEYVASKELTKIGGDLFREV